jgi:hypothetical protein
MKFYGEIDVFDPTEETSYCYVKICSLKNGSYANIDNVISMFYGGFLHGFEILKKSEKAKQDAYARASFYGNDVLSVPHPSQFGDDSLIAIQLFPPVENIDSVWFRKTDLEMLLTDHAKGDEVSPTNNEHMKALGLIMAWIKENNLQPGQVNSTAIQNFLGQNGFGYEKGTVFKAVWKSIPSTIKSIGGRPPKK